MLFEIFAWASLAVMIRAETVTSVSGSVTYNCPARSTIEAAYHDYCPSATNGGSGPLVGVTAAVSYYQAPDSYRTEQGDFTLECQYEPAGRLTCGYYAGGASPLTQNDGSDALCPAVSQSVPQPSPGVNYRRRDLEIQRRATVGQVPSFTCPFDSDDFDIAVLGVQVYTGASAVENSRDIVVEEGQVLYICGLVGAACYYIEDENGVVTAAGSEGDDNLICPQTLCNQVAPVGGSQPTRRGLFVEGDEARVRSNQVDTRRLRTSSN